MRLLGRRSGDYETILLKDGPAHAKECWHIQVVLGVIDPPTADLKVGWPKAITDMVDSWQPGETVFVAAPTFSRLDVVIAAQQ